MTDDDLIRLNDEEPESGDTAKDAGDPLSEPYPGEAPDAFTLSEEELSALCREHVCPGCEVMAEAEDKHLRAMADLENVKKRLTRETEHLRKYAAGSVLEDLLPVIDNLDLALAHAHQYEGCKDFVTGVDMTRKMFLDTLSRHGLTPVAAAQGDEFNPEFHEAVGMASEPGLADNTVAQVAQQGYMLKDRLLRPAKVLVNKKG